jgi:hypothetical protein
MNDSKATKFLRATNYLPIDLAFCPRGVVTSRPKESSKLPADDEQSARVELPDTPTLAKGIVDEADLGSEELLSK